jgi:metallo-beta-lactamase family protein
MRDLIQKGDSLFNFKGLKFTLTVEQSKEINHVVPPKIIIAGSGMSQGGRILHHELRYLPDPTTMVLFIGYQASASLGRKIMEGVTPVHILGQEVESNCQKRIISSYSAHADQLGLLRWLKPMRVNLKRVFLVHGELESSTTLAHKIQDELAIGATIPTIGQTVELS